MTNDHDESLPVRIADWVRSEGGALTVGTILCEFGSTDDDPAVLRAIAIAVRSGRLIEIMPGVYRWASVDRPPGNDD